MNNEVRSAQSVVSPLRRMVRQCDYFDPASGHQCAHAGVRLRLREPISGSTVIRFLCSHHSDWEQAS